MKRSWLAMAVGMCLSVACMAQAQGMEAVKKNMLERKPAVEQLLAARTVGENSAGFLEAIGKLAEADAKTVEAENADRKTVYAAIAARNGTEVGKVGQMRAAEIASKAKPGTSLQGADGKWTEKK